MKIILVICAVLSLALFSNASYVDDDDSESFDIETYATIADKFQCIRTGIEKVVSDNGDLLEWFKDVETTAANFVEQAKTCTTVENKSKCFKTLKNKAMLQIRRLIKAVPKDKKEMFKTISEVVKKCLTMS